MMKTTLPIPDELKHLDQWVCYCIEPKRDKNGELECDENGQQKFTKVPYQAITGFRADSTNPEHYASYKQVQDVLDRSQGRYNGIGFVFNAQMVPITGIDLDHCIDEHGNIDPWAQEIINTLDSYTELSPSKTGVHIFVRGVLPERLVKEELKRPGTKRGLKGKRDKKAAIEMYCEGRFFTVTGDHLPGTSKTIQARQKQIIALHTQITTPEQPTKEPTPKTPIPKEPLSLDDNELLDKAMKAKNSAKFAALWRGDFSGYASQSEADAALCQMLAFWTGSDASRIDSLFKRSGLYREKWDSTRGDSTYGQQTIENAIERCSEIYNPSALIPFPVSTPSQNGKTNSNGHHHSHEDEKQPQEIYQCFNLTDLGNAERFANRYRDTVRWCETWNTWLIFNGKCWEPDKTHTVDRLAKAIVRSIYKEAAAEPDDTIRKQIVKHAVSSEASKAVRAMLDRAKSELPATPDDFNKHLYLLNCDNGTIDLRTGQLLPHRSQDLLTRCLKITYNPLATSPQWETFIQGIFANDDNLILFMQQALGMSLCGDTSEQCLFICHGSGSNGKTTMLETIRIIMGNYGLAANIETFQVHKNESVRNDIAELYGARLVTASENSLGSRLNEAFVKKATGKEPLRARRLHENEFEFMPEFTIWLAVNHKPVVKDTSKGMWRRVHFIPFTVTIEGDQVDKHLGEKLLDESQGILTWLVQGCVAWYQKGRLHPPSTVLEATQAYRNEMDTIAHFIDDECVLQENAKTGTKQLLERYESWCNQNGERFNAKDLKTALNERGLHSKRGTGGLWVYHGIGLIAIDSDGSDGSDGKSEVNTRSTQTRQKIPILPSPTVTTVTTERENTKNSDGTVTKNHPQHTQTALLEDSVQTPAKKLLPQLSPVVAPYVHSNYYENMEHWLTKNGKSRPVKVCPQCKTNSWYPYWQRGDRAWGCLACQPELREDTHV